MTISEHYTNKIPEYYGTMYLDGYTPEQILMAARKAAMREHEDRIAEQEEPLQVKITSEVKKK